MLQGFGKVDGLRSSFTRNSFAGGLFSTGKQRVSQRFGFILCYLSVKWGWLGSRVVSVLDSSAEGPGFISQSRRCRVTVLGKLFAPVVPLSTKQQNW